MFSCGTFSKNKNNNKNSHSLVIYLHLTFSLFMHANFQLQCEMFETYSVGPHLEINVQKIN